MNEQRASRKSLTNNRTNSKGRTPEEQRAVDARIRSYRRDIKAGGHIEFWPRVDAMMQEE